MTDYQKSFVSESDLAKLKKYEQKIKDLGGDTSDDTKTDDTKTDTDTKTDDTKTDTDTKTDDTKTDDSKTENGSDQKSDETTGVPCASGGAGRMHTLGSSTGWTPAFRG